MGGHKKNSDIQEECDQMPKMVRTMSKRMNNQKIAKIVQTQKTNSRRPNRQKDE